MAINWTTHRRDIHRQTAVQEYLRQIVYGGNDGIVTTFAIVAGFAGAAAEGVAQIGGLAVLVFGLANLFADGVSMGLGEFLSGRAARDMYHARRSAEMRALQDDPEQELRELQQILQERGLPEHTAAQTASALGDHPEAVADLMMTYEFGQADPRDDTPAINGSFTFVAFLAFGVIPLVPYFVLPPTDTTFWISVGATLSALAALGLLRWSATGERLARTMGETMLVGIICAAVAYGVGWLVGG
ncbi:VIT1/CCC1 transporter family protein [Octadecabacter sp. R77987]|uniref:VIT1/CCC1 transporter family protein n=1 Tax=Octadecabacter sp. R77987 TaxID=3093874 RepID=UPI003672B606